MKIAVGFNPRILPNKASRRGATLESGLPRDRSSQGHNLLDPMA